MDNSQKSNIELRAAFFNNAQEGFIVFDKDLNFIDVNEVTVNTLRLEKEQLVGKNLKEISPDIEESERYQIYQKVIKTGKSEVIDQVMPHPSLGSITARVSVFKIEDGIGLSALNITDLKDVIEELNAFSYKTSRDMRSPLATIMGLVNVAEQESEDLSTALGYLEMIKQQAGRMDGVLKELIEFIQISSGEKGYYLIDFWQLVDQVLESLSGMDGYNDVNFDKQILAQHKFYSDKVLLKSMLQNLIDNAIKYRKKNLDTPWIKVSVTGEQQGVKICVADNGIGIEPEYQGEVFNMFFRATNLSAGIGLGLYSVQHCVKKLGGEITLESSEEGTIFTIYLPNGQEI